MVRLLVLLAGLLGAPLAAAHDPVAPAPVWEQRRIVFPDTAEYLTLVTDLHTHTAFSDGHVWPQIRVSEADRDGLDALAVTEHLEWQPHLADLPHPDRNRAYQVTQAAAAKLELLVIPGAEITREWPAGHMNALFIEDANQLLRAEPPADPSDAVGYYRQANAWPAQEAVQAANDQGAFVFWNHPQYPRPDSIAKMNSFHRRNARRQLLHGIEVANGHYYSQEAFALALEYDLTLLGVSDIHDLIDWDHPPHLGEHRPVTLVFARERSLAGIKEALFAKRTLVWFRNLLIGREAQMAAMLEAAISLEVTRRPKASDGGSDYEANETEILAVKLTNRSDARFLLRSQSPHTFTRDSALVELPPHSETHLGVKPSRRSQRFKLSFQVLNALTAPDTPATLAFTIPAAN